MALKRSVKTRFAVKIGKNASVAATMKRGTASSSSRACGGTIQARKSAARSRTYKRAGRLNVTRRDSATAASTDRSTPRNTSAFTNQVVPKSNANCTTFFVSSKRNAAPMKNRSVKRVIGLMGPPTPRIARRETRAISAIVTM